MGYKVNCNLKHRILCFLPKHIEASWLFFEMSRKGDLDWIRECTEVDGAMKRQQGE